MKKLPLLFVLLLMALWAGGCTSNATDQVLASHQLVEQHKQLAFDNALRIADEQMFLNLAQYIAANTDAATAAKITAAAQKVWIARLELYETRRQYGLSRHLTTVTVGQYLYDQQGILNIWAGQATDLWKLHVDSVEAADGAAGMSAHDELGAVLKRRVTP
jgi:hypothetical protein